MVIRAELPENNACYFRCQPAVGTIPRGTLVELLEQPVLIHRKNMGQYWAKILVSE